MVLVVWYNKIQKQNFIEGKPAFDIILSEHSLKVLVIFQRCFQNKFHLHSTSNLLKNKIKFKTILPTSIMRSMPLMLLFGRFH